MVDTIRVRCVAHNVGVRVVLPDEQIGDAMLRRGDVMDIVDTPALHIPRYRTPEHPKGWPAHLLERVDNTVPVTRRARAEGEPR